MKKTKAKKEDEGIFTITAKRKGNKISFDMKTEDWMTSEQAQSYVYEIICGLTEYLKALKEDEESGKKWMKENFPKHFREIEEKKQQKYIS